MRARVLLLSKKLELGFGNLRGSRRYACQRTHVLNSIVFYYLLLHMFTFIMDKRTKSKEHGL